jgi:hypothetical protein
MVEAVAVGVFLQNILDLPAAAAEADVLLLPARLEIPHQFLHHKEILEVMQPLEELEVVEVLE